jgi:molybdopterin converting factor small subunit
VKVTVLLFGPYADAVNGSSVAVDISASSCTAGEVKAQLAEQYPKLRGILGAAILAVNQQAVRPNHAVCETDELAIIGLVGGG